MPGGNLYRTGNRFEDFATQVSAFEVQQGLVTVKKPDDVPPGLQALRHTVGMVLMDRNTDHPRFAFHRQRPIPKKPDDYYRLEIVGGGIATLQQRDVEAFAAFNELLVDPLLWTDGKAPANFDFQYLGKGLLQNGSFPSLTPDVSGDALEHSLREGLRARVGYELGDKAQRSIDRPVILNTVLPRDTHLTSASFGSLTEQIAERHGMKIDPQTKKLLGIILTIREYFALATADVDQLLCDGGDRIEVHTVDSLEVLAQRTIYNERGEADLDVWKNRPSGSLRNSSLLAGVAAALMHVDRSMGGRFQKAMRHLKRLFSRGLAA